MPADIERLLELVKRCREARDRWSAALGTGDEYDRIDARNAYDAARDALGAQWQAIGEALEELARFRQPQPEGWRAAPATPRYTVRNLTGRVIYCEHCGARIMPGDEHGCGGGE